MDKTYQPADIEARWYAQWEKQGYFAPSGEGQAYSIMIPPPNVTGTLHMGHGFQEALMDALIRYHRMLGRNTLWQAGTDHAGIATQLVVERQLELEGSDRHSLGRDEFVKRAWQWKEQSGGAITQQLRRLGSSLDWSRERFTLDPGMSAAVRKVFIQLYREGLIYRGQGLVNWDPSLRTAVSDLEVVSTEEQGALWYFRYPLCSGDGALVVATTRPETMLGDSAVAVHPQDERYAHLVGETVQLPLTGRNIPVIADEQVDRQFGSGCVKITPAHDFNDYRMGQRHQLEMINILCDDASLNEQVPEGYRGLDRFEARRRIVADLESLGLLDRVEQHTFNVPRGDRSGVVIEPWLTSQWYVDAERLAGPAIAAVEQGAIRFVPRQWENTYFSWMRNIQDWCISRQLWWGHRIPAWYDQNGNHYVGESEAGIREEYRLDAELELRQDEDVLDTWFSSALWSFSTLGWPEETDELKTFHPTSVLVTGFDIIFFWVARMIMMSLHFRGEAPFHTVYVHGLVRDAHGQKMSKSKGNVLDPIDLIDGIELEALIAKRTSGLMQPQLAEQIEQQTRREYPAGIAAYGTDALRFTYYSLASTGRDIKFDIGRIQGFRNFCNKLWNAARYVLMHCEGKDCGANAGSNYQLGLAERWITARLQATAAEVSQHIANYRFDLASQAIHEFVWSQYCDWYLELSKPVLWDPEETEEVKIGARKTLVQVLESILRLSHPLMPFITEEIWQRVAGLAGKTGPTIMLQDYPQSDGSETSAAAQSDSADIEWLKGVIVGIRTVCGEMNIAPGRELSVLLRNGDENDRKRLAANRQYLKKLARLSEIRFLAEHETAPAASAVLVGELELLVPMAGLIAREAELASLARKIGKWEKPVQQAAAKLDNSRFVERAPATVVT
ncbi:MAG: valine--tRNA ligase, partial [Halieaceae bacterium]|nr:valine--tRNA ligase [Halieaceae bacterium]